MVADLRAKGQLNSNALAWMNEYVYWRIFIYFCCAVFFVIGGIAMAQKGHIAISLIFFSSISVFVFYCKAELIRMLKFYPVLYLNGETTEGIVSGLFKKGTGNSILPTGWELRYKYKINLNEYSSSTKFIPRWIVKPTYQKNDAVTVFYDPDNPERSVPYVPALYALFYLKK